MGAGTVDLYDETLEALEVPVTTTLDPTDTDPQFALSAVGADTPGTWRTGSWSGAWDPTTKRATAVTPLIGSAGTLVVEPGSSYRLWIKVAAGSETAVWPVGAIRVR